MSIKAHRLREARSARLLVSRGYGSRANCLRVMLGDCCHVLQRPSSSALPSNTCTTPEPRTARSRSPMPTLSDTASGANRSRTPSSRPSHTASSPSRSPGADQAARTDGPRITRSLGFRSKTAAHRRTDGRDGSGLPLYLEILIVVAIPPLGRMAEIQWSLVAKAPLAWGRKRPWLIPKTPPRKLNTGGPHEAARRHVQPLFQGRGAEPGPAKSLCANPDRPWMKNER
jgi:hypothetical protein